MLANENPFFERVLFESLGTDTKVHDVTFASGGCINNTLNLKTDQGNFFLKYNEQVDEDMFEAEYRGLQILAHSQTVPVPEPIHHGNVEGRKFLLMEHLEKERTAPDYWENLGRSLAAMHKMSQDRFGLDHQNYIGKLPQKNEWKSSWIDFFIDNRLEVQLGLAIYNKEVDNSFVRRFRQLYPRLPDILPDEKPALVHGDLWSGNVMQGPGGKAYLIDPAVYYGSRETDLAMTKMFGGFDAAFYHSYQEAFPTPPGLEERIPIYNLYNVMVHVNLFGQGYLSAAERTLKKYV